MIKILSLLTTRIDRTEEVIEELRRIPQVKELFFITGKYDIALIIGGASSYEIYSVFTNDIDAIDGIISSESHLIMDHLDINKENPSGEDTP
jgi:DNA-binding Lrp family transcriptional regulator